MLGSGSAGGSSLDAYYMKYRRPVLGAMLFCYLVVFALAAAMRGAFSTGLTSYAYIIVLTLTLLAPGKSASRPRALIAVDIWAFIPTL